MRFLCSSAKNGVTRTVGGGGSVATPRWSPRRARVVTWLWRQTRWIGEKGTEGTEGTKGTGSSPIKPNQTKSNRIGRVGGGCAVDSGQWLVAAGGWRKRTAESSPVKPSQTQSNRFDSGLSKNTTILSEMLMLLPWPKLHSVRLIKPNQTKSNLRVGKKIKIQRSRFQIQWSKHHNTR